MKKIICFSVILFVYSLLFSQTQDSIGNSDYKWKIPIEKQDQEERMNADRNPVIKRVSDTLGSDYLEQHFYHNGNLYYQVPVIQGKRNGIYEEYHPNGQLKYKSEIKNGDPIYTCDEIFFDRFGDISSYSTCISYKRKNYYCVTSYFFGELSKLRIYIGEPSNLIYNDNNMVAEFAFDRENNKWIKHDYHCRSVRYAGKLLRIYKKRMDEFLNSHTEKNVNDIQM